MEAYAQALADAAISDSESEAGSEEETPAANTMPVFIHDKSKRRAAFKKRKGGLMKKGYELATLTGTQVLVLAVSENGLVYTFTTARLQSLVTKPEGKNLIQACLNAPLGTTPAATPSVNASSQAMAGGNPQPGLAAPPSSPKPDTAAGVISANIDSAENELYFRNDRFWLQDGNIILSAKLFEPLQSPNPPRYMLFRVHKSILSRHSEVFEHMFGAVSSPDAEGTLNEMYEGLPIVEMTDSKEHLCGLLDVLYGGISLPFKHFDPRAYDTSRLVLEIAAKYEMNSIRQRVIAHIEDYWPNSLAAWDIFETRLQNIEDDDARDDEMDCFAQEPVSTIMLARRFDIRRILPAAFYDLTRIPASCDLTLRQARAEDAPEDEVDNDTWNVRAACWARLSIEDYHRVCVARERLRAKAVRAVGRALHARPAKGCYNLTRCRDQSAKAQTETREQCYVSYDVLKVLKDAVDRVAVCPPCREEIKNELQMCRKEIWRDLPTTFSL